MPHIFTTNPLRTGNQRMVRQINLTLILDQLRQFAPLSRADLAKLTGLNKTTISSLVAELMESITIHETGLNGDNTIGRPSMQLMLNPAAGYIISLELGINYLYAVCADFTGKIFWRKQVRLTSHDEPKPVIMEALDLLIEANAIGQEFSPNGLGAAIALPGLVNTEKGTLIFAPNLGWKNIPVRDWLQTVFPLPILVFNENYLGGLAEFSAGAGEKMNSGLYIAANTGLGGAILSNRRDQSHPVVMPARFGHMTADPTGIVCTCGNRGCWETQINERQIIQQVQQKIRTGQKSSDTLSAEGLTIPLILQAASRGNQIALEVFHQTGTYLGIGLANLINALSPQVVILGDMLAATSEYLLPAALHEMRRHVLGWNEAQAPQVLIGHFGEDAAVQGGIISVYQQYLPKGN